METFLNIFVDFLWPLALLAAGFGFFELRKLMAAKLNNETVRGILMRLSDAVETAAKSVGQTYVDNLKRHNKFDQNAQKEARKKALEAAKSYLGPKGLNELAKVMGWDGKETDAQLSNKIEAEVSKNK